jgi:hypothetical protein
MTLVGVRKLRNIDLAFYPQKCRGSASTAAVTTAAL